MSGHSHQTALSGGESKEDEINIGKIVLIGALSLLVFAVGIVWAYYLMVGRQHDVRRLGPARATPEIGKTEIGIVDQIPFEVDTRLEQWREMSRRKLAGHGWVDRAQGIARIPIETAMERVIANPPDIPGEGGVPAAAPVQVPGTLPPRGAAKAARVNP